MSAKKRDRQKMTEIYVDDFPDIDFCRRKFRQILDKTNKEYERIVVVVFSEQFNPAKKKGRK